jgi:hypothetical protein
VFSTYDTITIDRGNIVSKSGFRSTGRRKCKYRKRVASARSNFASHVPRVHSPSRSSHNGAFSRRNPEPAGCRKIASPPPPPTAGNPLIQNGYGILSLSLSLSLLYTSRWARSLQSLHFIPRSLSFNFLPATPFPKPAINHLILRHAMFLFPSNFISNAQLGVLIPSILVYGHTNSSLRLSF